MAFPHPTRGSHGRFPISYDTSFPPLPRQHVPSESVLSKLTSINDQISSVMEGSRDNLLDCVVKVTLPRILNNSDLKEMDVLFRLFDHYLPRATTSQRETFKHKILQKFPPNLETAVAQVKTQFDKERDPIAFLRFHNLWLTNESFATYLKTHFTTLSLLDIFKHNIPTFAIQNRVQEANDLVLLRIVPEIFDLKVSNSTNAKEVIRLLKEKLHIHDEEEQEVESSEDPTDSASQTDAEDDVSETAQQAPPITHVFKEVEPVPPQPVAEFETAFNEVTFQTFFTTLTTHFSGFKTSSREIIELKTKYDNARTTLSFAPTALKDKPEAIKLLDLNLYVGFFDEVVTHLNTIRKQKEEIATTTLAIRKKFVEFIEKLNAQSNNLLHEMGEVANSHQGLSSAEDPKAQPASGWLPSWGNKNTEGLQRPEPFAPSNPNNKWNESNLTEFLTQLSQYFQSTKILIEKIVTHNGDVVNHTAKLKSTLKANQDPNTSKMLKDEHADLKTQSKKALDDLNLLLSQAEWFKTYIAGLFDAKDKELDEWTAYFVALMGEALNALHNLDRAIHNNHRNVTRDYTPLTASRTVPYKIT